MLLWKNYKEPPKRAYQRAEAVTRGVRATWASNFIKKETLVHVFSCEFSEISQNTFFTEHLRTTASGSL